MADSLSKYLTELEPNLQGLLHSAPISLHPAGFASGIRRIGAIIGPTFGGILVQLNLSVQMNFLSFALPGIIAAIAFSLFL